jgi:hypothetical protein
MYIQLVINSLNRITYILKRQETAIIYSHFRNFTYVLAQIIRIGQSKSNTNIEPCQYIAVTPVNIYLSILPHDGPDGPKHAANTKLAQYEQVNK